MSSDSTPTTRLGHVAATTGGWSVVDGLVAALLKQREAARARRDFATADAIRDALTPSASRSPTPRRAPLDPARDGSVDMPGNSQRKGAVRRKGKGNTAGSGGRVRRGLEGKGPTPKAEDRPYHPAYRAKKAAGEVARRRRPSRPRTGRPGAGPEWVAGRNAVLEAMEAEIPIKTAYVAEGAERDDRLRDILKLAAARGLPCWR